ncbi:TIGR03943 family putative permease subunit [Halalkalibacter alkalisediminis]|uniref:TIGR03943 family putative permease subunit n=1 Tax=Halalkalibacter alkalisediminis TaxID=935616 RepID=A0ABV6NDQ9_9BACI|nr:TIGR03943 family protein [Halalkalibacter alkalisediminis]
MVKAIILLLFAVFIFILHETGEINRFINPNYLYFSQIASVIFLFLFFIQVPRIFTSSKFDHSECGPWGCSHEDDEGGITVKTLLTYGLIIMPLLTGFLLPYKDFGAAEALKRGISYSTHDHGHLEGHDELFLHQMDKRVQEMLKKPVLEFDNENFASYISTVTSYPENFVGKPIIVEGFILEDDSLSNKLTVITRFLVTHCVADAHAAGLVIEKGVSFGIQENTWIRVKGVLNVKKSNSKLIPIITVSSWEEIESPMDPYVYP